MDVRPHPRIRKTIKYGGAALTVLLVVVWIGSGWWTIWTPVAYVSAGEFAIIKMARQLPPAGTVLRPMDPVSSLPTASIPWQLERMPFSLTGTHTPLYRNVTTGFRRVLISASVIQLWPIVLASAIGTLAAWGLDTLARRRERMNLCPKCHYDRTGLAGDAVCPECGAASLTPPAPQSPRVS